MNYGIIYYYTLSLFYQKFDRVRELKIRKEVSLQSKMRFKLKQRQQAGYS